MRHVRHYSADECKVDAANAYNQERQTRLEGQPMSHTPCKCHIRGILSPGSSAREENEIVYCPLHAAALNLKESLFALIEIVESLPLNESADRRYYKQAIREAKQAIAHAERQG